MLCYPLGNLTAVTIIEILVGTKSEILILLETANHFDHYQRHAVSFITISTVFVLHK